MPDAAVTDDDLVRLFPGRGIDRDNAGFYRGWLDHELRIERCSDCATWHHPPRPVCPACWSTDVVPTAVAGTGTVHLLVLLHQGPPASGVDYAASPHPVVVVELDEQTGLRVTATVVGTAPEDLAIGDRVELDWGQRDGAPMPVFRVVSGGAA